jgi:hypothetical protein
VLNKYAGPTIEYKGALRTEKENENNLLEFKLFDSMPLNNIAG